MPADHGPIPAGDSAAGRKNAAAACQSQTTAPAWAKATNVVNSGPNRSAACTVAGQPIWV